MSFKHDPYRGIAFDKRGVEAPVFFELLEYWFPVQLMQKNDSWCFSAGVDLGCPPRLCTGFNIITFSPSKSPKEKLSLIKRWGFRCYTHHFIMIQLRPVYTMSKQTNIDKGGFGMGRKKESRWNKGLEREKGAKQSLGGGTTYWFAFPEEQLIAGQGEVARFPALDKLPAHLLLLQLAFNKWLAILVHNCKKTKIQNDQCLIIKGFI